MEGLQTQAATLKKVNRPSDDPSATSQVLRIRSEKANIEQFQLNSRIAENYLMNTDQAISDLSDVVSRAKELAISQSSMASSSDDTRKGVSEEVRQLFQQAVSVANRRVGDRYIFGGYKTQTSPVDANGAYSGDQGQMMVEIGDDVFIAMNVPGSEVFNTKPNTAAKGQNGYSEPGQENVNVFDELQHLNIGLLSGDLDAIRDTLERFDQLHGQLISIRAKVGSRIQGLQYTNQAMDRQQISNSVLSSSLEDADVAQVVSDLNKEESVFKSSLAASKRLIQPTLLDFLR
jgi:flagellar hook-associated protein 3 FlgL